MILSAGISGREVPQTHLSKILLVFGSFTSILVVCLFISMWHNLSRMTPFEGEVWRRAKQTKEFEENSDLRREANWVIKNFILLIFRFG